MTPGRINTPRQVLFASLVGTTVEFFDFYIYAMAAVLVFPALFFPSSNPASAVLLSLATFGVAFFARPIGSALFGHFGDRIGRKRTLVIALGTMGISTFLIGALPGYATLGVFAPLLLAVCRFGQGIGLGGEWGGAVLLAVENAPPRRRAFYGMFPQLGAPLGFMLSGVSFLILSRALSNQQFLSFGWRIPFLASSVLVLLGLYVRLTITETPIFREAAERGEPVKVPLLDVLRHYPREVFAGILLFLATFVLFYLMIVFTPAWAKALHYPSTRILSFQLIATILFAAATPLSAWLAEYGRRRAMILFNVAIGIFGFAFAPLFTSGVRGTFLMMLIGLTLMGLVYGAQGTLISELFPTSVRYTGSSIAFSMGGVLGASATPYIAMQLATKYGLKYVGYYLTAAAVLSVIGLLLIRETKDEDLNTTIATVVTLQS
ncbi:MAG TPA: MFS transporter [Acidobacteriaceae bacterium]|nr:MFS transporter [Acidobacteriaceae bacterium]